MNKSNNSRKKTKPVSPGKPALFFQPLFRECFSEGLSRPVTNGLTPGGSPLLGVNILGIVGWFLTPQKLSTRNRLVIHKQFTDLFTALRSKLDHICARDELLVLDFFEFLHKRELELFNQEPPQWFHAGAWGSGTRALRGPIRTFFVITVSGIRMFTLRPGNCARTCRLQQFFWFCFDRLHN